MPCAIYLRKSRKDMDAEARGEGETLARHENALRALARRQGLQIVEVYREIVTGDSIAARPQMQRLLSDVQNGAYDGVLVVEVERLARGDTMDQGRVQLAFTYSDTKIITPDKTYDPSNEFDNEYFEFGLFMSRREYNTIKRRLNAGRDAAAREGCFISSIPPYGYRRARIGGRPSLEPDPQEAPVLRSIFDWYVNGIILEDGNRKRLGVALITNRLNDMKVPPRKGKFWVNATIQDILRNPVYIGTIRRKYKHVDKVFKDGKVILKYTRAQREDMIQAKGLHEPLIDIATFQRAQESLDNCRPAPVPQNKELTNPLAGLMVCGRCRHKMVRRGYQGRQEPSLMCPYKECDNVSSDFSIVEAQVLVALEEWLKKFEIASIHGHSPKEGEIASEETIQHIDAELKKLEEQRDKLHDFLERGVYSETEFFRRRKTLADRELDLRTQKGTIMEEVKRKKIRKAVSAIYIPRVRTAIDTYCEMPTPQAKNELLREILEKIVYVRLKGGRWCKDKFNFSLELYPRWPAIEDSDQLLWPRPSR